MQAVKGFMKIYKWIVGLGDVVKHQQFEPSHFHAMETDRYIQYLRWKPSSQAEVKRKEAEEIRQMADVFDIPLIGLSQKTRFYALW